MTSYNFIVFKSVVRKKGDESFQKNPILGGNRTQVGVCATNAPILIHIQII
jgi:hypothetical protein